MAAKTIGSAQGIINLGGDQDWFKVQLQADTLYTFTTGTQTGRFIVVFDAQGRLVEQIDALGFNGSLAFTPLVGGTYFIAVAGMSGPVSYTYTLASVDDDYLSNTRTTGTIAVGGTVSGVINAPGDVDWIRVDLTANTLYRLSTGLAKDMIFVIHDPSGEVVDEPDAIGFGAGGEHGFMPSRSGTYFISISDARGNTPSYSLSITPSPDDFRDNVTTSGELAVGQSVNGVINVPGEVDWLRLNLVANQLYTLSTSVASPTGSSFLSLSVADSQGLALEQSDAQGSGTISFTPAVSGTYYVSVSDIASLSSGYAIRLSLVDDDHVSNITTKGSVAVGDEIAGRINAVGDRDWIRVSLNANTLYAISAQFEASGSVAQIYDANGAPVNRPDATGFGSELAFTPLASGTYYIEVGGFLSPVLGSGYTLAVEAVADDFPSNSTTTGVIAVDGTAKGVLQAEGDHDWFKVDLKADTLYEFSFTHSLPIQAYLASGAGEVIEDDFSLGSSDSRLVYMPAVSGTFFLGVTGFGASPDSYQISLRAVPDDFTNNIRTAGVIGGAAPPANAAPVMATITPIEFVDTPQADVFVPVVGFQVSATDANADPLRYGLDGGVTQAGGELSLKGRFGTLVLNPQTGAASFLHDNAAIQSLKADASETFTVTVTDGKVTTNGTLTVRVKGVNDSPVVSKPLADAAATAGTAFTYTVPADAFADADLDILTFSVASAGNSGLPTWLTFNAQTRTLSGTPTNADAGAVEIRVTASDGITSISDTFKITTAAESVLVEGVVVDGYVSGASIFIDRNGNNLAEPEEDTGLKTNATGRFMGRVSGQGALMATGGTNTDTGLPNTLTWRAPAGSTVISPVSTLIETIMDQAGIQAAAAKDRAAAALGLPTNVDLLKFDPLAPGAGAVGLAVQQANAQIVLAMGLLGDEQAVLNKMTQAINALPAGGTLDLSKESVLAEIAGAGIAAATVRKAATLATAVDKTPSIQAVSTILGNEFKAASPGVVRVGTSGAETLDGGAGDDEISAGDGQDRLRGGPGNDRLDGGGGRDVAVMAGKRESYQLVRGADGTITSTGPDGNDTLTGIERVVFEDKALAFDVNGIGGKTYRLYAAAYDRVPDAIGVGFWMYYLDDNFPMKDAADAFLVSKEFAELYDADPTTPGNQEPSIENFVIKLYRHVHQRTPDEGGYQFWVDAMNNKDGKFGKFWSRGEVLIEFAESAENYAKVIGVIENGFEYVPFVPPGS